MTNPLEVLNFSPTDDAATKLAKRTFASGYMLGKKHGYTQAVDESYPELTPEGVGNAVGDLITEYLNPHQARQDPKDDFGG